MKLLSVPAKLNGIHHDVFGRHKGKLAHHMLLNDLGIYYQSIHHIQTKIKDSVNGKEALRHGKPLVCGIIQGSLKPLGCRGDGRIQGIDHDVS